MMDPARRTRRFIALLATIVTLHAGVALAADLPANAERLPMLNIPIRPAPAKLTGDLSDPAWTAGLPTSSVSLNNAFTGRPMSIATRAEAFATGDALYVAFTCDEPVAGDLKTDGDFWTRDSVEIFFEPTGDLHEKPYHQIAIDSRGQCEFTRGHVYPYPKYFSMKAGEEKWTPKIEVATSRSDTGWIVEARIPFDQMKGAGKPTEGPWRFNFYRTRPARDKQPGMNWGWAPTGAKSYHMAGRFGLATISAGGGGEQIVTVGPVSQQSQFDRAWRAPAADVFVTEVDREVAKLKEGIDFAQAAEQLKKFSRQTISGPVIVAERVQTIFRGRITTTPAIEAARDVLADALMLPLENDDDAPPKEIRNRVDAFEARVYHDKDGMRLPYRLLKPANVDPNAKYPVVLFLHGSGEVGSDNRRQLADGSLIFSSPKYLKDYPCFVIAPQAPLGEGWANSAKDGEADLPVTKSGFHYLDRPRDTIRMALELTDSILKEFPAIDTTRIYVSGASMGGFGTYDAVLRRPEYFAAAAPIAGAGDPRRASHFTRTPFHLYHGEKDTSVKPEFAQEMYDAIRAAGGKVELTIVPNGPHGILPSETDEYVQWLFAQHR